MNTRVFMGASILLALTLILLTASFAWGCAPEEDGAIRCTTASMLARDQRAVASQTNPVKPTPAPAVAKVTRTGVSPETALEPVFIRPQDCIDMMCPGANSAPTLENAGGWQWIKPASLVWYGMNDWGSLQVSIWLFANGQGGLEMEIFAPDQKDLWNAKPVGRGSPNPSQRPADLFWTGRSQAGGVWYAKIINRNPFPVYYSLRFTRSIPSIPNRCDACHGPLKDLMWDRCVSGEGSNWCNDLQGLYSTNPSTYDHSVK